MINSGWMFAISNPVVILKIDRLTRRLMRPKIDDGRE